jgi:bifunctional non-homologous end joining protein LigD
VVEVAHDVDHPGSTVFDLDPMPGATFANALDVARWLHDALDRLGVAAWAKTSGASGLHLYVPLAAGTSFEASRTFCATIAGFVAAAHPRVATVERTIERYGATVYIDCLQNLRTKTLATAYSARATRQATVSTPVTWEEIDAGVDPRDFTVRTMAARLRAVGDPWAGLRGASGVDLAALAARAAPARRPAGRRR